MARINVEELPREGFKTALRQSLFARFQEFITLLYVPERIVFTDGKCHCSSPEKIYLKNN
jgi:hypothetical protein